MRQRGTLAFREAPQKNGGSTARYRSEELESFRKLTPRRELSGKREDCAA